MMFRLFALLGLLLLTDCGKRAIDYPLAAGESNIDRRRIEAEADRPLVVLAFSGGGSRAAALAAAVTARLDGITYPTPTGKRRMSQDIDVVSSVSGGSVYAAEIGLHGTGGDTARAFEQRIGAFDGIGGYLLPRAADPFTWISLQLENQTRITILQDMIGDLLQITPDTTLARFNQPGQPVILMNASDMVAGEIFSFEPAMFDDLCMSFDRVPVSLAVTASAAFPFAFTPVLLKNDSYPPGNCLGRQQPPGNWHNALGVPAGRYTNLADFRQARYRDSLRAAPAAFRQPDYVRLVDGGVVDNLGLGAVRRTLLTPGSPVDIARLSQQGKLRHLVVISVNARSDARNPLDDSPRYTDLLDMAEAVSGVLVDSAAAGSAETFQAFIATLAEDRASLLRQGVAQAGFELYPISIDFDQLPDTTAAEQDELTRVKSIATSWTLADGDIALLDKVAGELLWRHPCFRKLLNDIHGTGREEAASVADAACPVPSTAGQ
jgi:NTE family protein